MYPDFFKNLFLIIKIIQIIEYSIKKIKQFPNWTKKNIDNILKFIYSKITNTIIYIFLRLSFFIFFLQIILSYSISIQKQDLSFEKYLLTTIAFITLTAITWIFFDKLYKNYLKDRTSYSKTKHTLKIV
jgi:magnesium-transporting ATPase (P-type)